MLGCFLIVVRPLEQTNLLCLAKFEYQSNHQFAVVRILLYRCM